MKMSLYIRVDNAFYHYTAELLFIIYKYNPSNTVYVTNEHVINECNTCFEIRTCTRLTTIRVDMT